jgi:hypothetical protein
MPKMNVSGMNVEALMDLRKRVEETLINVVLTLNSSWREWRLL